MKNKFITDKHVFKMDNYMKILRVGDILALLFFLIRIRNEHETMKYYRFLKLDNAHQILASLLKLIILSKFRSACDFVIGFHYILLILTTKEKNKVIGICHFKIRKKSSQTCSLGIVISDQYAGKGLGTRFLLDSLQYVRKLGFREVTLEVDKDNLPAYSLYKKLGFISTMEQQKIDYRAVKSIDVISMVLKM